MCVLNAVKLKIRDARGNNLQEGKRGQFHNIDAWQRLVSGFSLDLNSQSAAHFGQVKSIF